MIKVFNLVALFWSFLFLNVSVFFLLILLLFHHLDMDQCFTAVFWISISRCLWKHTAEDVYEVVQSPQVAVLPVALHPGSPVVQSLRGRQRDRLPKVDHPHPGLPWGIMHKQQGAAHDLQWRNRWDNDGIISQMFKSKLGQQVCLEVLKTEWVSHLMCPEEVRVLKGRSKFLQPLQIEFLRTVK